MKKNILRIALALLVAIFAATAAMAWNPYVLNFQNENLGYISLGETYSSGTLEYSGIMGPEIFGNSRDDEGTLVLTSTGRAHAIYVNDSGQQVGSDIWFEPGKPVSFQVKSNPQAIDGRLQPHDGNGNFLRLSSEKINQTAFSGGEYELKVGSYTSKGKIPTMPTNKELTDDLPMPFIELIYSTDRTKIEGIKWRFVKRSDTKTPVTYHAGDKVATLAFIHVGTYSRKYQSSASVKFEDEKPMEGVWDTKIQGNQFQAVDLADLSFVSVHYCLNDATDRQDIQVLQNFTYYMQGNLSISPYVTIRQSLAKTVSGKEFSSIGLPTANMMGFEISNPGTNATGTIEFTPPKDLTASYTQNGAVVASEVYKAGVKHTITMRRYLSAYVPYMEMVDSAGRIISFRATESEDNAYVLNGVKYTAKVGNWSSNGTVPDFVKVSALVKDHATPNIKCTLNDEGKITKIDWWFSKGNNRSVAAKYADGDHINYVSVFQIRTNAAKNRVRYNAPGFGKSFSNGETMSGTWELEEDQYVTPDEIGLIRVGAANRSSYKDNDGNTRYSTIGYGVSYYPVAVTIDKNDVKDTGSDGAKVESAEPNQPTPSEFASAIEALVDAMKRVMELIKDSPVLKAFDVINTIKMEVSHTKDDGTANVAIENFEREPKAGYEFVVLTKRKISLADGGKWDMHRGVKYDRTAHRLSFSIPNVGWYFSTSDVVLAEAQIDGGGNGGSGGGCAAGAAAMLALGCLVAIKARKR